MVKVIRTTPLESEVNCGKKNAVSFRFLRAATLLKSGFGVAGCLLAPPAPPPPSLSKETAPNARSNVAIPAGAAPGAAAIAIAGDLAQIGLRRRGLLISASCPATPFFVEGNRSQCQVKRRHSRRRGLTWHWER